MVSYTMGWILALERKFMLCDELQREAIWDSKRTISTRKLSDITVGVLGTGSIGRSIAEAAKVFFIFSVLLNCQGLFFFLAGTRDVYNWFQKEFACIAGPLPKCYL